MKALRKLLPPLLAVALAITTPLATAEASSVSASKSKGSTFSSSEIDSLLRKSSATEQATTFARRITDILKYVTSRSFVGKDKSGKWLGFVDIYSQYQNGEPTGYILERASAQYGMESMPKGTESCILKVGDRTKEMAYNSKEPTAFNFATTPVFVLDKTASSATPKLTVHSNSSDTDIVMKQAYPGNSIPSLQETLTAMAPAYINFVNARGDNTEIDHAVLRLRSYVTDKTSLSRSYTWELTLVHGARLPSKATIIRYDVSSEKINISQRELRSYFS